MDIYAELDKFVEENEGQVTLTDVVKHFADYGYQYAIDKACEWLQENLYVLRTFRDPLVNKYEIFIKMLRRAMKE